MNNTVAAACREITCKIAMARHRLWCPGIKLTADDVTFDGVVPTVARIVSQYCSQNRTDRAEHNPGFNPVLTATTR